MIRRALALIAAGVPLAGAAPAVAQPPQGAVSAVAPSGATSACIGQTATAVCAAETLLACLARAEPALCRRVGMAPPPGPPSRIEYVVERASTIRAEEVTEELRELDWFRPGYALVEIMRRTCASEQPSCAGESWEPVQIYLRPVDGGWHMVALRGEADQDTVPELPETVRGQAE